MLYRLISKRSTVLRYRHLLHTAQIWNGPSFTWSKNRETRLFEFFHFTVIRSRFCFLISLCSEEPNMLAR